MLDLVDLNSYTVYRVKGVPPQLREFPCRFRGIAT